MEETNQHRDEASASISVDLSPEKLDSLKDQFRYALLAKVLYKRVGFYRLYYHLLRLWSPNGKISMHEHANEFFVIVFSDPLDYIKALGGVPWTISGHYITLRPFEFNFKPWEASETSTAVWVRLPEFPVELYDNEVFKLVASALGGYLVRCHSVTEKRLKVRFARICVKLDLSQPLLPWIKICGQWQRIEYEGLHVICTSCRRSGHFKEECAFTPFNPVRPSLDSQGSNLAVNGSGSGSGSSSLLYEATTRHLLDGESDFSFVMNVESSTAGKDDAGSPDFHTKVTSTHLHHGEGVSSFAMNVKSSIANKDDVGSPDFHKEATFRNLQVDESNLLSWEAESSKLELLSEVPDEVKTSRPSNLDSASDMHPFIQFQLSSDPVKELTEHKEIDAKSLHLIELKQDPLILSIEQGVSSIQTRFGVSRVILTPNRSDHDACSNAVVSKKKILCWACGGSDDAKVAQTMNELIKTHRPSLAFLSEISSSSSETYQVISDSEFYGPFFTNPAGSFGDMWLFWREEEVGVTIQSAGLTHINAMLEF